MISTFTQFHPVRGNADVSLFAVAAYGLNEGDRAALAVFDGDAAAQFPDAAISILILNELAGDVVAYKIDLYGVHVCFQVNRAGVQQSHSRVRR